MTFEQINAMRDNVRELAAWYEPRGIWTEDETLEIGRAIGADINRNDAERLSCWERWLKAEVEEVRRLTAAAGVRCRAIEASIHATKARAA